MDEQKLWKAVLEELQLTLSKANFSAWFSQTDLIKVKKISADKQTAQIGVPNPFVKETIKKKYLSDVQKIINRITDKETTVDLKIQTTKTRKPKKDLGPLFEKEKQQQTKVRRKIRQIGLKEDYTFETFAVSSTNEAAYAAAQSVAKNPGMTYQLLFLYGGVGVGKTHLMHAIAHQIIEDAPEKKSVYCTGEEFTNEIIEAIRKKSTSSFRKKYRSAKILLIDDVQFIGGKDAVQEEFFHTFNAIHRAKGQIIITSDREPHEIEGLEDRLRSRFEGGLAIDIQRPNFELRTAILLIKSRQMDNPIPMDVAQIVAANIESTRALEGFLMRLITEGQRKGESITPEFTRSLMGKTKKEKAKKKHTSAKEVIREVADYFDLKIKQLKGRRRKKEIVVPRQVAMYLLRTEMGVPFMKIGDLFGGRDHTTAMHAVEKITKELSISESLRLDVASLKKKLFT
jgi:chromosomal replication initiator protein